MSDLVGNPEDRFSHNEAQIILCEKWVQRNKKPTRAKNLMAAKHSLGSKHLEENTHSLSFNPILYFWHTGHMVKSFYTQAYRQDLLSVLAGIVVSEASNRYIPATNFCLKIEN